MRKAGVPEEAIQLRLNVKSVVSPHRYALMLKAGISELAVAQRAHLDSSGVIPYIIRSKRLFYFFKHELSVFVQFKTKF